MRELGEGRIGIGDAGQKLDWEGVGTGGRRPGLGLGTGGSHGTGGGLDERRRPGARPVA